MAVLGAMLVLGSIVTGLGLSEARPGERTVMHREAPQVNGAVVVTPPDLPELQLPRALGHLHARLVTLADADTVLAFRRQVLAQMPAALRAIDPARGLLPEVEQAWAAKHLGPSATTLALFDDQTLIAFACLLQANAQDPEDPGHLLNLAAP
jgi:hypothetical protein